jgi:hypothetical protein
MVNADVENDWWIPDVKVASYYFGKHISEISSFFEKNKKDLDFEDILYNELEFYELETYISIDKNFELTTKDGIIDSLCCRNYFYINKSNMIGRSFNEFCDNVKKYLNVNDLMLKRDKFVFYENGDKQRDINIDQFSIFVTVNEVGTILSVSVLC